jgi:hypothetical protein
MQSEFETDEVLKMSFELLRLEELLSQIDPQECCVDLHELMYRCGWAAAMAHRSSPDAAERKSADDC